MRQFLVYDLPMRFFHWLFAILFLTAFIIAKTVDDESLTYAYHMLAGLTLVFLVLLRLIWGFIGTKHARFSGYALNPADLLFYFRGFIAGDKKLWAGHNPASSWAALTMMIFALGLGISGFLMTSGPNKEDYEDIHELLANGFIIVVVAHITGIILHTLRHREMIALTMIDGKKSDVSPGDVVPSVRSGAAVVFILLVAGFGFYLFKNFNTQNGALQIFGTTLQLGEKEDSEDTEAASNGISKGDQIDDANIEIDEDDSVEEDGDDGD